MGDKANAAHVRCVRNLHYMQALLAQDRLLCDISAARQGVLSLTRPLFPFPLYRAAPMPMVCCTPGSTTTTPCTSRSR